MFFFYHYSTGILLYEKQQFYQNTLYFIYHKINKL
jgi:hypothetical protein